MSTRFPCSSAIRAVRMLPPTRFGSITHTSRASALIVAFRVTAAWADHTVSGLNSLTSSALPSSTPRLMAGGIR